MPKDQHQKKLQGTDRKDRNIEHLVEFDLITILPETKPWQSTKGKKYFNDIATMLIEKKMLFSSDVHLVMILSEEMATYENAQSKLKVAKNLIMKSPKGYQQQSPWVSIRNVAMKNIIDIGSIFGFDPLSRSKMGTKAPKEPSDDFQKLLNKYE